MNRRVLSALAILLVVAAGCTGKSRVKEGAGEERLPVVKVATAVKGPVMQQAEFTGSIQPLVENNISPSLGLRIDKINVDVGDKVYKGEVLVEMDKRQYLQAAIQLSNLEVDYERMEKLYQEGGVSKQQLDQLQTQLSVSRHATANLRDNADLVSPINGIVTARMYDPGDVYSQAVGRILTVMQMDRVKVQINVSERYFTDVKVGMPVDITLEVYPGRVFKGKVSLIYPALDPLTRTFTVEVTIPNAKMELRPGMFCKVNLNFGEKERILIPDVAVQKQIGTNERYIFIYKDGVVTRSIVETGRVVGQNVEIIKGIEERDEVVIAGAQKLMDQTVVKLQK